MSSRAKVLIVAGVVLVVLVGGFLWWFFQDDAPDEVSLESAVDQVTTTTGDGSSTTVADSGIDGTWTIDTESGDFDFESATGTFAGFRIDEELGGIGSATAVGRTGDVTGSFTIEGNQVTEGSFEVDLSTITTNESRRDGKVQEALETGEFPTATFELTQPIDLPDGAADGDSIEVTATGDLTVHGVTESVDFPMQAQLVNGTVVLVGSIDLPLSDFQIEKPTSPIVLSIADDFTLELQFLLTRG